MLLQGQKATPTHMRTLPQETNGPSHKQNSKGKDPKHLSCSFSKDTNLKTNHALRSLSNGMLK